MTRLLLLFAIAATLAACGVRGDPEPPQLAPTEQTGGMAG